MQPWDAHKHLLYALGNAATQLASLADEQAIAKAGVSRLKKAARLHAKISDVGISVKDGANRYQANWAAALDGFAKKHQSEFEYLMLVRKQGR
jgi:hypothetical protein